MFKNSYSSSSTRKKRKKSKFTTTKKRVKKVCSATDTSRLQLDVRRSNETNQITRLVIRISVRGTFRNLSAISVSKCRLACHVKFHILLSDLIEWCRDMQHCNKSPSVHEAYRMRLRLDCLGIFLHVTLLSHPPVRFIPPFHVCYHQMVYISSYLWIGKRLKIKRKKHWAVNFSQPKLIFSV